MVILYHIFSQYSITNFNNTQYLKNSQYVRLGENGNLHFFETLGFEPFSMRHKPLVSD